MTTSSSVIHRCRDSALDRGNEKNSKDDVVATVNDDPNPSDDDDGVFFVDEDNESICDDGVSRTSNRLTAVRSGTSWARCPRVWFVWVTAASIVLLIGAVRFKLKNKNDSGNVKSEQQREREREKLLPPSGCDRTNELQAFSLEGMQGNENGYFLCDPCINCRTDRWSHAHPSSDVEEKKGNGTTVNDDSKLYVGQALCNDEYRFGVIRAYSTFQTSLVWQDCNAGTIYYLQNVTLSHDWDYNTVAFQLSSSGALQLWEVFVKDGELLRPSNDGDDESYRQSLVWELPSAYEAEIGVTEKCLSDHPVMDCPYLHLRKRGGNIVLNYISSDDGPKWQARPIKKAYPGLFPDGFDP